MTQMVTDEIRQSARGERYFEKYMVCTGAEEVALRFNDGWMPQSPPHILRSLFLSGGLYSFRNPAHHWLLLENVWPDELYGPSWIMELRPVQSDVWVRGEDGVIVTTPHMNERQLEDQKFTSRPLRLWRGISLWRLEELHLKIDQLLES